MRQTINFDASFMARKDDNNDDLSYPVYLVIGDLQVYVTICKKTISGVRDGFI